MSSPSWLPRASLSVSRLVRQSVLGGLVLGLALGCSGSDDPEIEEPGAPIPCDVQRVLERNCLRCHGEHKEYGAPYSFTSLEEIHRVRGGEPLYRRMHEALEDDFMPPVTLNVEPPV